MELQIFACGILPHLQVECQVPAPDKDGAGLMDCTRPHCTIAMGDLKLRGTALLTNVDARA